MYLCAMTIEELTTITEAQVQDVLGLMKELNADIPVTPEMVRRAVEAPGTHFFAVLDGAHIVGCASLCVCESPTGRKAHVEDVVVSSACRGQHLGRRLIERVLAFAREELADIDVYLTSRPSRIAANALYRAVGFQPKETNVYKLALTSADKYSV